MAEVFGALGIAANIAQFVDYARQLIAGGKEIYNSVHGARDEHRALKVIIEDINNHETYRAQSGFPVSTDELAFRKLATECAPVAEKLLCILEDLEVPNGARFRGLQTIRQTLRSAAKKKDIQDLQRRLADIDVRLRDRASRMLQNTNYSSITTAINTLSQTNERLKVETILTLEKLRDDIVKTLNQHDDAATGVHTGLENLSTQLLALAEECVKVDRQHKILKSLIFEEIMQREETIKDAHQATLDWVIENNETNFTDWLKTEKGIYWVRGKAGSGKSTLMKYICNDWRTLNVLRSWAGLEKLVTASFFFWNSGFRMQRSQVGLLQSLLYQVLRACPSLVVDVCRSKDPMKPWKRIELFDTLKAIFQQRALPAKFCFFVDGLDEYEGDDEDIIALLQDITSSPSVKMCVSSRPWNSFVDAFDKSQWKLVLENFTRYDMQKYTYTILVQNEAFKKVAREDPRCETLVLQIAEKAHGVWLWVYLVVRDLVRDLKGEEGFPLLQRRLDSFPDELEKYFACILDQIDKIYREDTAKILLMACEAVRPIPLISLHYLSMEGADPDYVFKLKIAPISHQESYQIKIKWKKLLNSRCRDLLEVRSLIWDDGHPFKNNVEFLHRTVRDFLRDNYQDDLRMQAGENFNAKVSLCNTIISLIKITHPLDDIIARTDELNIEFLFYARHLERIEDRSIIALLDELDRTNAFRKKDLSCHWTNTIYISGDDDYTFLAVAIRTGLRSYVYQKLDMNPALIRKRGRPLLDYALRPWVGGVKIDQFWKDDIFDIPMLRFLLERGSNPNDEFDGYTVWSLFLSECCDKLRELYPPKDCWNDAIELMIDHGADRTVKVPEYIFENCAIMIPIEQILKKVFNNENALRLIARMDRVAQENRGQTSLFWRWIGWK